MMSPQMQEFVEVLLRRRVARAGAPPRDMAEVRAAFAPFGNPDELPDDVVATEVADVPAYWLDTPGVHPARALLFLHGGGYSLGSLRSHGSLAAEIGRATGRRVLFCEYRLAPEHQFPAAVEDALATWRWLAGRVGPASVVVAGDSAGGGLALALMHAVRDAGEPLPAGAVLMSPLVDMTMSGASIEERDGQDPIFTPEMLRGVAAAYLGDADPKNPAASPLYGAQAGLPPLLIQVGTAELLYSDAERLADAAATAGVDVTLQTGDGLPHVYQGVLGTPESAAAISETAAFTARL